MKWPASGGHTGASRSSSGNNQAGAGGVKRESVSTGRRPPRRGPLDTDAPVWSLLPAAYLRRVDELQAAMDHALAATENHPDVARHVVRAVAVARDEVHEPDGGPIGADVPAAAP